MASALSERDTAIALLKTAIAALGEELVDKGASVLPRAKTEQFDTIASIQSAAADAAVLVLSV